MPDFNDSESSDYPYIRILVSGLLITTVYVGLRIWETKQSEDLVKLSEDLAKESEDLVHKAREELRAACNKMIRNSMDEKANNRLDAAQSSKEDERQLSDLKNKRRALRKRKRRLATNGSGTAQSSREDESQMSDSSTEHDRLSPMKASKGKRKRPSGRAGPPDMPSFPQALTSFPPEPCPPEPCPPEPCPPESPSWPPLISSFNDLAITPSGTPPRVSKPVQNTAEKGKNVLKAEKGVRSGGPKSEETQSPLLDKEHSGGLPPEKLGPMLDEHDGAPKPYKGFRTTEDGVSHVDCNFDSNFLKEMDAFGSRLGEIWTKDERKILPEDAVGGNRPPQTTAALKKKEQPQSTAGEMNPQKKKSSSKLKEEPQSTRGESSLQKRKPSSKSEKKSPGDTHPPQATAALRKKEQALCIAGEMNPQKGKSSSKLKEESLSHGKTIVLPKIQTVNRLFASITDVVVMSTCQPAWEAQQYIDHACKDDPDSTKALKKEFITAYLQYHKDNTDPDEDLFSQSTSDASDIPVPTSLKRANAKKKIATAVEVSNSASDRPSQCMFFSKLPPEIRILVYRQILTTKAVLNAGAEIKKMTRSLTTDDNDPSHISNINSAVMQTCRKMYQETLPVLYGENKFGFRTPEDLEAFREGNLETTQSEISVR